MENHVHNSLASASGRKKKIFVLLLQVSVNLKLLQKLFKTEENYKDPLSSNINYILSQDN